MFLNLGVLGLLGKALCLMWQPSFELLRLEYTVVAMGLLLYRVPAGKIIGLRF